MESHAVGGAGLEGPALERLREAAAWRLLARLFERPREGWARELKDLAGEVDDPTLHAAAAAAAREASEGAYLALLGPGGAVSPRQVAYVRMAQPGALLGRVAALYEAFSFQPQGENPPDHVATQADFMSYLGLKEAYARSRGQTEEAQVTADAAALFLAEHLRSCAEPLAAALEAAGAGYLTLAAHALLARTGPRPPEARLPVLPTEDEGALSCGEA